MAKRSFKAMTLSLTGLTEKQYAKEFKSFSKRVANYNKLTGANYSAAKEFYYSKKFTEEQYSPALAAISKTVTTQAHYKGEQLRTFTAKGTATKAERDAFAAVSQAWKGYATGTRPSATDGSAVASSPYGRQLFAGHGKPYYVIKSTGEAIQFPHYDRATKQWTVKTVVDPDKIYTTPQWPGQQPERNPDGTPKLLTAADITKALREWSDWVMAKRESGEDPAFNS